MSTPSSKPIHSEFQEITSLLIDLKHDQRFTSTDSKIKNQWFDTFHHWCILYNRISQCIRKKQPCIAYINKEKVLLKNEISAILDCICGASYNANSIKIDSPSSFTIGPGEKKTYQNEDWENKNIIERIKEKMSSKMKYQLTKTDFISCNSNSNTKVNNVLTKSAKQSITKPKEENKWLSYRPLGTEVNVSKERLTTNYYWESKERLHTNNTLESKEKFNKHYYGDNDEENDKAPISGNLPMKLFEGHDSKNSGIKPTHFTNYWFKKSMNLINNYSNMQDKNKRNNSHSLSKINRSQIKSHNDKDQ